MNLQRHLRLPPHGRLAAAGRSGRRQGAWLHAGGGTIVQLELADCARELQGLLAQRFRCRRGLLHQRGVLLGHLIKLRDRLADVADVVALLGGRGGDFVNDAGHAAHAAHDFGHGLACLAHEARAIFHALDR